MLSSYFKFSFNLKFTQKRVHFNLGFLKIGQFQAESATETGHSEPLTCQKDLSMRRKFGRSPVSSKNSNHLDLVTLNHKSFFSAATKRPTRLRNVTQRLQKPDRDWTSLNDGG